VYWTGIKIKIEKRGKKKKFNKYGLKGEKNNLF
jgi:hypothetical protein